jgi:hypothetical protein
MNIEPNHFANLLLCIIIVMIGVTWSFSMYFYISQQQEAGIQGAIVIKNVNDKLDSLHKQSVDIQNAQGNVTAVQRDKIIKDFENVPAGGLASHKDALMNNHVLNEILANLTKQ